jgi:hypothetical protein
MTPPQRALFLTGLKEEVRRWGQPIPVDTSRWSEGSFVLVDQPSVRTILNDGGSIYLQRVDDPPRRSGIPEEIGTPVAAPSARVDQVRFQFRYGPGAPREVGLLVAPLVMGSGD